MSIRRGGRNRRTRVDGGPAARAAGPPRTAGTGSHTRHFQALTEKPGLPFIRLHDLRHTTASLALAAGVEMKVVSEVSATARPRSRLTSTPTSTGVWGPRRPTGSPAL